MSEVQSEILILTEEAAPDAAIDAKPDGELADGFIFKRVLRFTGADLC